MHPSYRRPAEALKCYRDWLSKMKSQVYLEWIISLNNTDLTRNNYLNEFEGEGVTIIESPSLNMVQATNAAASASKQEILILVSDDMYACEGWDKKIIERIDAIKGPAVLQVHDTIRCDILTIPVMNRAAYDMLGYVYYPGYVSMYADNDLTEVAKSLGIYYDATDIRFEHKHYTVGKSKLDNTYAKENSPYAMKLGKSLFEQRKKTNWQ